MKKGYAIALDSVIALIFAIAILMAAAGYQKYKTEETSFKRLHYVSEDVFDALNKQGVLDDVGEEWAAANGSINSTHWINAENISKTYLEQLIPPNMGYRLTIEGETIAENTTRVVEEKAPSETKSERLLVGYGKGLPTRGYVSRAFLTKIKEKTNSAYSYFGGFIGQGDVTQYIRNIPDDAFIHQACLELNAGDSFDLYVNDAYAGHFTPSGGEMDANIKDSDGCIANPRTYFTTGDNKFQLKFTGTDLNKKYVGGGFLKIIYNTTEPETEQEVKTQQDWMPGVNGLINYYSSIYVPGTLNSTEIFLHFRSNHTTFMTLGDVQLFDTSKNESLAYCSITDSIEYNCTLPDDYIDSKMSYSALSRNTIPLRIGIGNISSISNVDVVLVNDRSGSMRQSGWTLTTEGNASITFNNVSVPSGGWSTAQYFTINSSVKKLAATITWDRKAGYNGSEGSEFVINLRKPDGSYIFTYSGTPNGASGAVDPPDSIGGANEYYSGICTKPQTLLVENPQSGTWRVVVYGWNFRPDTNPPSSMSVNISIYADTNLTSGDDLNKTNTTLSNEAAIIAADTFVRQLAPEDYASYVKFGSYATTPQGLTENKTRVEIAINNTGLEGGTAIQLGIDDANDELIAHGRANVQHIIILLTDGQNDAGPETVIQSANYAKNNGTKIFTIGLTDFINEDMLKNVASKPEYYYHAPTAEDLQEIYNEIAGVINDTYRSQIVNTSENINYTILYGDSYVQTTFEPEEDAGYGELSFVMSTDPFNDEENCNGFLYVPSDVKISDAKITSYSGTHWTDFLSVQNNEEYNEVYKLWYDYGDLPYTMLGDPYTVQIPIQYLPSNVNHSIKIETGDSQSTRTSCSADDRAIYTIRLKMLVNYGQVFQYAGGCIWTIEFEDGSLMTSKIPLDYNETEECYYTSSNRTISKYDTIDDSVYRLMNHLDIDKDGRVDVIFDPNEVEFETSRAGGVKSLWGPTEFKLILWM